MKKYLFSIFLILISIGCFIAYNVIGSKLLEDGTLSESFYLIPMGYIFTFISIISIIVTYIRAKKNKNNNI